MRRKTGIRQMLMLVAAIGYATLTNGCATPKPITNNTAQAMQHKGGIYFEGEVVEYDDTKEERSSIPLFARIIVGPDVGKVTRDYRIMVKNSNGVTRTFEHFAYKSVPGWKPEEGWESKNFFPPSIGDRVRVYLGDMDRGCENEECLSLETTLDLGKVLSKIKNANPLKTNPPGYDAWKMLQGAIGIIQGETDIQTAEDKIRLEALERWKQRYDQYGPAVGNNQKDIEKRIQDLNRLRDKYQN